MKLEMEFPNYFLEFTKRSQRTDKFPSDSNYNKLLSIIKLQKGEIMEGLTVDKKKRVRREFKIDIENGLEYLASVRSGKKILKHSQFFTEMMFHHDNSGHSGRDITYKKLHAVFENVPIKLVSSYIALCGACSNRRYKRTDGQPPMDRLQIDFDTDYRLGQSKMCPVNQKKQSDQYQANLKTPDSLLIPKIDRNEFDDTLGTTEYIKHYSSSSSTICGNCNNAAENRMVSTITIEDDYSIMNTDVTVWDAIVYIYGVSWKEVQDFYKQYSNKSTSVRIDSTVNLCDTCMPLLSENYKTHKKFNEASNSVSIIQRFAEFCKRGSSSVKHKVESDISCSSSADIRPENHGHVDNLFDDFNFDDGNYTESFIEEDNLGEQKHEPSTDSVRTENEINVNVAHESCVTKGSLKAKAYVKLQKLSEEDYRKFPGVLSNFSEANNNKSGFDLDYQPEDDVVPKRAKRQKLSVERKSSLAKKTHKKNPHKEDQSLSDKLDVEMDDALKSSEMPEKQKGGENSKKSEESCDSKTIYQCDKCEKTFILKNSFQHHQKTHNDNPSYYNCKICGRSYRQSSYGAFRDHVLSHSGEKRFECRTCKARFKTRPQLYSHKLVHLKEFNFSCEQCGKCFKLLGQLNGHQKTHTNEEHICTDCNRCFRSKEYLKKHRQRVHSGQKFICEECGSTFSTRYRLTFHAKHKHRKELIYECEICGKHLSCDIRLKTHMWTHTGEKPLVCKVEGCDSKFSNQDAFDAHVRSHSGLKFECTVCGKKFDRKQYLRWHFRIHTGEKPKKRIAKLKTGNETDLGQILNPAVTLSDLNTSSGYNDLTNGSFIGHRNC